MFRLFIYRFESLIIEKLNRKYLASILKYEPTEGTYLVEFYDGVQCHVKPNNMRKPRKGEDGDHQQETLKVNGVDNESAENSENEDHVGGGVGNSSGTRRERKRKFDVKQLFGVRSVKSLRSNSQEESSLEASTPKNNDKDFIENFPAPSYFVQRTKYDNIHAIFAYRQ